MTTKHQIILEILSFLFLIGILLPALISSKSTTLVVLGMAIIVGVILFLCQQLPIKSQVIKFINH